jgi:Raf kinase inhibitor-like YbhB/YbcL family protein
MQLTSPAFDDGARIPTRYTCDGEDVSPPLRWSDVPDGTRGFVIIMDDPDAPPGTWVHWVLYDLPADVDHLDEGVPKREKLEGGAKQGACWGVSSFSRVGYFGPCPPPGKPHRYSFRLYAVDTVLDLPPDQDKDHVEKAMKNHVLAEAELAGLYGR